jgi:hypothetical protein
MTVVLLNRDIAAHHATISEPDAGSSRTLLSQP